jgi:hypothetical protein
VCDCVCKIEGVCVCVCERVLERINARMCAFVCHVMRVCVSCDHTRFYTREIAKMPRKSFLFRLREGEQVTTTVVKRVHRYASLAGASKKSRQHVFCAVLCVRTSK